jgi:hypothetical protein
MTMQEIHDLFDGLEAAVTELVAAKDARIAELEAQNKDPFVVVLTAPVTSVVGAQGNTVRLTIATPAEDAVVELDVDGFQPFAVISNTFPQAYDWQAWWEDPGMHTITATLRSAKDMALPTPPSSSVQIEVLPVPVP